MGPWDVLGSFGWQIAVFLNPIRKYDKPTTPFIIKCSRIFSVLVINYAAFVCILETIMSFSAICLIDCDIKFKLILEY